MRNLESLACLSDGSLAGSAYPRPPSKVRKVFEIGGIGLDFRIPGSGVPVRGGTGSGVFVKYPTRTIRVSGHVLGERKKAVRA